MPIQPKTAAAARVRGTLITRKRFAKISAVEGIVLSAELEKAFERFDTEGWPPEKRRAFIREQFRKKSA